MGIAWKYRDENRFYPFLFFCFILFWFSPLFFLFQRLFFSFLFPVSHAAVLLQPSFSFLFVCCPLFFSPKYFFFSPNVFQPKNTFFSPKRFCFSPKLFFNSAQNVFLFFIFLFFQFSHSSLFLFFCFILFWFSPLFFSLSVPLFFFSVSCFPRCCSAPALFSYSFCVLPFIFQTKILLFPTLLFLSTHSFGYFELNLSWRIFFPTSTILKFEPIF